MSDDNQNSIDLDIEDSNELLFKVRIEGTDPAPAKVRLVCESSNGDISYLFNGCALNEDDLVQFNIPNMNNKLKEGNYKGRIEVLVENRYFTPVEFNINFKKTMKVVAEAVNNFVLRKPQETSVTVSALPIVVPKTPKQIPVQPQPTREVPQIKPQEVPVKKITTLPTPQQHPIKKTLSNSVNETKDNEVREEENSKDKQLKRIKSLITNIF